MPSHRTDAACFLALAHFRLLATKQSLKQSSRAFANEETIMKQTILVAASFGLVSSLFAAATDCVTPDKVTLQLKWVPQAQFAGYYVARELGYYKDQCLDVTIRPGGLDIEPEEVVGRGAAQFGIAWQPSMLASRDRGVSMQAIAQVFQYSGMRLISWKTSNISGPEDLKGKTVAVWFAGNEFELLATLPT